MKISSRTMLLLGTSSVLAMLHFTAHAQTQDTKLSSDPDDPQIEEIVVKGFRSSIENSIAAKKGSSSIVEAISAEDIGKLPDVSIAESLARLPGLTTQRSMDVARCFPFAVLARISPQPC
ncbi:hypothetical protein JCM17845_06880 [Iodidimonas gelatinilytica]|uniref:TonB-dependent receptor plug domain-containing protein n=1 Tax=Iodidimonas gelatinilytica TaxID=1236966 RepID=A0A5A7MX94_9PROT|nr:hypothetical protein [Iodidimonas gelatinilytica]GER00065.1 hypothetical protein JCM17845_06880 [Iodidimonas gelatinilytica]